MNASPENAACDMLKDSTTSTQAVWGNSLRSWRDQISCTEILQREGIHTYSSEADIAKMGCWCHRNAWWTLTNRNREFQVGTHSQWPEEMLQGYHKSLPQWLQHTPRVIERNCTWPSKAALPYQKRSRWFGRKDNLWSWKTIPTIESQIQFAIIRRILVRNCLKLQKLADYSYLRCLISHHKTHVKQ